MHGQHNIFVNANRFDPTRTLTLRKQYERDMVRRFRKVAKAIVDEVWKRDGFGLTTNQGRFDFPTSARKVASFMGWLENQVAADILDIILGTPVESAARNSWQNVYIRSAYQKGIAHSASRLRAQGVEVSHRFIDSAFFRPLHADRAGLIFTRTYTSLQGITNAMSSAISQVLASGIIEGDGPEVIARALVDRVNKIGITRARMLARTEVIRAHAEATLNTYTEAGIEGVTVLSEFTTAGDDHVCVICEALEGTQYTIEDARGVIPVHPNCRCAWLPVVINPAGVKLL